MHSKISTLIAATAMASLLSACGSTDDCCVTSGGLAGEVAAVANESPCVPGSQADFVENVGDRVWFDFDKSSLRTDGSETLQRQAEWLNKYTNYVVTIDGHCDSRGTVEYNLALGERRANAARNALIADGVDASRIKVVSYGKNKPIVEQKDGDEWAYQQNRVAITVLD